MRKDVEEREKEGKFGKEGGGRERENEEGEKANIANASILN